MIRGMYIGRPAISGVISFVLFLARALKQFIWNNPIIDFLNEPVVVFLLFLLAGIVITYPFLKGWRALVITPLMVLLITFFVYTYYLI